MHLSALLSSMHCKHTELKKTFEKYILLQKPNQRFVQILKHFVSRYSFFMYSFGMAHSFVDSIGDVDVISDAEVNMKRVCNFICL